MPSVSIFRWPWRRTLLSATLLVGAALGAGHMFGKVYARSHPQSSCPFAPSVGRPAAFALGRASVPASGDDLIAPFAWHGLSVGLSSRQEVDAWLAARACACYQRLSPRECVCEVPGEIGPSLQQADRATVFVEMDRAGKLRAMSLLTVFPHVQQAVAAFAAEDAAFKAALGLRQEALATATDEQLATQLMKQRATRYVRQNMYAKLSVTNFGDHFTIIQAVASL